MFVESAIVTGAPRVEPTSSGLTAYQRQSLFDTHTDKSQAAQQRALLADADDLSSHLLLFPEARLIEYDCGKLQSLARLLRRLHADGHRCLIFTQMSRMLDVLEAFLSYHAYTYLRLDGATRIEHRQLLMERFNSDPRVFVFILSTRSGGMGVNLTGADTVIFYDSDWNPTMDAQAQDRAHRIGQTRDVHIYRCGAFS
jgi:SNF2 family DNA or RNA helicase